MSFGILLQSHKNLTQFCNIISGGNCDNLQVSARDISFSYEIFNGHVDTIKFAISACGLII